MIIIVKFLRKLGKLDLAKETGLVSMSTFLAMLAFCV